MIGWLLKIAGGLSGRLWSGLALAAAVGGAFLWHGHTRFSDGLTEGRGQVTAEWRRDIERRDAAYRGEIARQVKINREIEHGLTEKLADADRRGRDLAGRLLSYQRALAVARAAAAAAPAGTPAGAAGEPEGAGEPGEAVAEGTREYFATCERDATRLAEWQAWWGKINRDPVP